MNALLNRRGVELAIGTIVVLAIVVLVMIVVIGFFLTGFGKSGSGIAQISGEGERGASNIKLDFRCLGTPSMSNADCDACAHNYNNVQDATANCKLCTITEAANIRTRQREPVGSKDSSAKCSVFTEPVGCNDPFKAKGCYWGYGGQSE